MAGWNAWYSSKNPSLESSYFKAWSIGRRIGCIQTPWSHPSNLSRQSISSNASSFWSDPVGYQAFSASELPRGRFFWPIRPPTRATNILIFSSSWTNCPSRVMRFGCIFCCGSANGSRRRCNCRSWSRRRCRCWRWLSSPTRRSRSCRYLHRPSSALVNFWIVGIADLWRSSSFAVGYSSSVVRSAIFLGWSKSVSQHGQLVFKDMEENYRWFDKSTVVSNPFSYDPKLRASWLIIDQ